MIFRQLFDKDSCTYTYLLGDPVTRESILIDSVIDQFERDSRIIKELDLKLTHVIETHVHADHITGAGRLKTAFKCSVGLSEKSRAIGADIYFKDQDFIIFGDYTIEVLETPGHTSGCLCYIMRDRVFTGDSLLIRTCGRTDFQDGDPESLYNSIHTKLFTLPDDILVYPAHNYSGETVSSIWEEKIYNNRLIRPLADFVKLMNELKLDLPQRMNEALPANLNCGIV